MNPQVTVLVPSVAESVIGVSAVMPTVVIVNVAVVAPAATVTFAGKVAAALVEARVTTSPEGPAGLARVTVPVEVNPPYPEPGVARMLVRPANLMVRLAVAEPFRVAVMAAVVAVDTADVVTEKVAVVAPAATVTVAGTVALVELDARVTDDPPVGAALEIVTVPVEETPPVTVLGERARAVILGALIVSGCDLV